MSVQCACVLPPVIFAIQLSLDTPTVKPDDSSNCHVCPQSHLPCVTHTPLFAHTHTHTQERFTAVRTATGVPISPIPSCGDDLYIAGRPCIDFVWTPSNDTAAQVGSVGWVGGWMQAAGGCWSTAEA